MGISISNATSSAITKYSVSLRSGEPDWSMIPSAGKSNKSQAEFVSEIKELAQRAANTTSKTELESIHRQRTRLCAECDILNSVTFWHFIGQINRPITLPISV